MPKPITPALVAEAIEIALFSENFDWLDLDTDTEKSDSPNAVIVTAGRDDEDDRRFRVTVEPV